MNGWGMVAVGSVLGEEGKPEDGVRRQDEVQTLKSKEAPTCSSVPRADAFVACSRGCYSEQLGASLVSGITTTLMKRF